LQETRVEIISPNTDSKSYSNWDIVKYGLLQGPIFGSLLFLLHIDDPPKIISSRSKPVLFPFDTSIIIYHLESNYFHYSINNVLADVNWWFKANKLTLNFDKDMS
jgi:hypothetical protein